MTDESYNNQGLYFFRVAYDGFFFIIVNVIIMNIVFGIIIDAFAGKIPPPLTHVPKP